MSSDIKEKGQKNKIMPNERKSTFISFCKVLYASICIAMAACLVALAVTAFWEIDQTHFEEKTEHPYAEINYSETDVPVTRGFAG